MAKAEAAAGSWIKWSSERTDRRSRTLWSFLATGDSRLVFNLPETETHGKSMWTCDLSCIGQVAGPE